MGLLFLSRHESRLVLYGREEDPTWSAWPGSDLAEAGEEDQDEAAFEARVRRTNPPPIDVNASSKHWHSSTRVRAFLVAQGADGQAMIGVGNCTTRSRKGWQGTSSVRLSAWRTFDDPVPVSELLQRVPLRVRHVVKRMFAEEDSRAMPNATSAAVFEAMRVLIPDLDEILNQLPRFQPLARLPVDRLAELDAGQSALRFFSPKWRSLEPVPDPVGPSPLASRLESVATPNEDEVITGDTGGFLDWESDGRASNGWYEFRSGNRQLLVKNINFKSTEPATGADLVYVRSPPESVVLVQYKMLEANKGSYDYFFRDDGRLGNQVRQMLSFSTAQVSSATGDDDYRLANDIGFVKFVEPSQPSRSGDVVGLPNGRYHPAEGVLRMLAKPSKGDRGGDVFRVREWRSLDGETFAKLVRDEWIGSSGVATERLLEILKLAPGNPLYLAVEEPVARST